jgi:hypothetical protein
MFNGNLGLLNTEHEYLIMLKYCKMNSLRHRFKIKNNSWLLRN